MTVRAHAPAPRSRVAILVALCLAAFIISVDVTIVNVALPTLVARLGASTTQLQWVVDAYSLVFAALVLAAGSLSDRLGRKGILLIGLTVFAVGSLAGAFSGTIAELIASRAFMGLGAALMFPSTLSLLVNVFTQRGERAMAIGLWGATTGVGIATGPIVGGWLLERYWWGSIFAFMAVVAAGIAVLVAVSVPSSRDPSTPPIDWRGLTLSAAGMTVLIFGVIEAPDWGWTSPSALACLAGGLALLSIFVLVEQRTEYPMLDVALFRNPRFTAASGSVAISFFALSGFIFLVVQYFQIVKGYTPLGTGVRLLPVAGSVAATSVVGTKLAVRVGNKAIVGTGLLLFATGLLWASTASGSTTYLVIVGQMLFLGSGMGLTSAPATEAIMGARTCGEGRSWICRQRCHPPLRRYARGGSHWERGHVPVQEPTLVGVAIWSTRASRTERKGLGRRSDYRLSPALEARIRSGGTWARPLRHQRVPLQLGRRLSGCRSRHHRRGSRRYCVPAGPTGATRGKPGSIRSTRRIEFFFRCRTSAGQRSTSCRQFEVMSMQRRIVKRRRT